MANVTYPTKGQIVSMELGTSAAAGINNQYRVLKANDSVIQVVALYDYSISTPFNSKTLTTSIGAITVQKYSGSSLDTLLNTTFYASLSDEAKSAIVKAEGLTQDVWFWSVPLKYKDNIKTYAGKYGTFGASQSEYKVSLYLDDDANVYTEDCGDRYIYALGIQDIIDYLDVTTTMTSDTTLTNVNIWKMLWNSDSLGYRVITPEGDENPNDEDWYEKNSEGEYVKSTDTTVVSGKTYYVEITVTYPWLRSGYAGYSEYIWRFGGLDGFVTYGFHDYENRAARPVFTIDLSKLTEIEWSIVE